MNEDLKVLDIVDQQENIPFNIIALGVPDSFPAARGFYEASKVKYI